MVLLAIIALWLLLVTLVSGLCRAAKAGDEVRAPAVETGEWVAGAAGR